MYARRGTHLLAQHVHRSRAPSSVQLGSRCQVNEERTRFGSHASWIRSTRGLVSCCALRIIQEGRGKNRRNNKHTSAQAHHQPWTLGSFSLSGETQHLTRLLHRGCRNPATRPGFSTSAPGRLCVCETSPGTAARQAFRQVPYTFHAGRYASGKTILFWTDAATPVGGHNGTTAAGL